MKNQLKKSREYSAVISRIVQILKTDVIVEGSLSQVEIPYGVRNHVTYKENGKTRTVYVPVDRVGEMRGYVQNWKEVKELLKQASAIALSSFKESVKSEKEAKKTKGL